MLLSFWSALITNNTPLAFEREQLVQQNQTIAQEVVEKHIIRTLPGKLNQIPVFNSNSPELVLNSGILLSTFPPTEKTHPSAHLNYGFIGKFDIFAHHVAKAPTENDLRTLYLGILIHNPEDNPVKLKILRGATYLSQPDAPFIRLSTQIPNPDSKIYAGPGSRVMDAILRGKRQAIFPQTIVIPPKTSRMMINLPIPVKDLEPPINGRSTYLKLESTGKVYAASLAMFAPTDEQNQERPPTLSEWEKLLTTADLVTPRDRAPTTPHTEGNIIYGRVAGVSLGSMWQATLTDNPENSKNLTIPNQGESISYPISSLARGTFGTKQIQSAPMLVRYPDTAYQAHGNYGVRYSLNLPLYNPKNMTQTVTISLQTPLKQDKISDGLKFLEPPAQQVFFRGTVRLQYPNSQGIMKSQYWHLVQQRGQKGEPLVTLSIPPGRNLPITVDLLYPPDATPPQILTIKTQPN